MPSWMYFLQLIRSWRIDDTEDVNPSTPIINVVPSIENPQKLFSKDKGVPANPVIQDSKMFNSGVLVSFITFVIFLYYLSNYQNAICFIYLDNLLSIPDKNFATKTILRNNS